jgi:hypothetical protein
MPSMTDEAVWLRSAFDGIEPAERASLAHLLDGPPAPARSHGGLRSVVGTAGAFGLVLATSLLLGHPRS